MPPSTNRKFESSISTPLIIAYIGTTIGTSIPLGYHLSVVNSPAEYIKVWCNDTLIHRYDIHLSPMYLENLWATVVSIFLAGGAIGSVGGSWLADKYGRKIPLFIIGIAYLLGTFCFVICRVAVLLELLLMGRFLVGIASGLTTTIVPMYQAEVSPLTLRGPAATLTSMGVCFGVLLGQIFSLPSTFGTVELWHYSFGFHAVFSIFCLIFYPWYPESPMYLYIVAHKNGEAEDELRKLRGSKSKLVEEEMSLMAEEAKNKSKQRSIWSVAIDPTLLMPLILVCALQAGQQMSGINVVFYYSVSIYEAAGLSTESANWANLGAGIITILTASTSPFIMAKLNRRPVILVSCALCGLFLSLLTVIVYYINLATWLPFASIVAIFSFIVSFEIGLGPVPYFIASELFESAPRPAAMAIGCLISWVFNFFTGMIFPSLQMAWGAIVFLPFAICCFALVILLKIYLPETRCRDPSDVAPLVMDGFRSRPLKRILPINSIN